MFRFWVMISSKFPCISIILIHTLAISNIELVKLQWSNLNMKSRSQLEKLFTKHDNVSSIIPIISSCVMSLIFVVPA